MQEVSGDGSEFGFNSEKTRYFYWGELKVQFTGKSTRSHGDHWSRKNLWGAPMFTGAEEMPETEKSEKEQKDTTPSQGSRSSQREEHSTTCCEESL